MKGLATLGVTCLERLRGRQNCRENRTCFDNYRGQSIGECRLNYEPVVRRSGALRELVTLHKELLEVLVVSESGVDKPGTHMNVSIRPRHSLSHAHDPHRLPALREGEGRFEPGLLLSFVRNTVSKVRWCSKWPWRGIQEGDRGREAAPTNEDYAHKKICTLQLSWISGSAKISSLNFKQVRIVRPCQPPRGPKPLSILPSYQSRTFEPNQQQCSS
jgi:hypothetical protein